MVTGLEDLPPAQLDIPELRLLHTSSKPVKDELEGAKMGVFWDTENNKSLGKEIDVIVVGVDRFCTANKNPERGQIFGKFVGTFSEDYYKNYNVGFWPVVDDSGNILTLTAKHLYLVRVGKSWEPYIFYWTKSNFKYNNRFANKIRAKKDKNKNPLPLWGAIWHIKPVKLENENGAWYALGKGKEPAVEFLDYTPETIANTIEYTREMWEAYTASMTERDTAKIEQPKALTEQPKTDYPPEDSDIPF